MPGVNAHGHARRCSTSPAGSDQDHQGHLQPQYRAAQQGGLRIAVLQSAGPRSGCRSRSRPRRVDAPGSRHRQRGRRFGELPGQAGLQRRFPVTARGPGRRGRAAGRGVGRRTRTIPRCSPARCRPGPGWPGGTSPPTTPAPTSTWRSTGCPTAPWSAPPEGHRCGERNPVRPGAGAYEVVVYPFSDPAGQASTTFDFRGSRSGRTCRTSR